MKKQPRAPSFIGLTAASPLCSRTKKANISRDTGPELALNAELSKLRVLFATHVHDLPGRPDIVFERARLDVFCDGDFWHGKNWAALRRKLAHGKNASYWCAKIGWNIQRDKRITNELRASGWRVMRVWESEIKKNPRRVAIQLREILRSCNRKSSRDPSLTSRQETA